MAGRGRHWGAGPFCGRRRRLGGRVIGGGRRLRKHLNARSRQPVESRPAVDGPSAGSAMGSEGAATIDVRGSPLARRLRVVSCRGIKQGLGGPRIFPSPLAEGRTHAPCCGNAHFCTSSATIPRAVRRARPKRRPPARPQRLCLAHKSFGFFRFFASPPAALRAARDKTRAPVSFRGRPDGAGLILGRDIPPSFSPWVASSESGGVLGTRAPMLARIADLFRKQGLGPWLQTVP